MTSNYHSYSKAFAINFKSLDRWDPGSYHGINWLWPKNIMTPIRDVLKIRKDKVDKNKVNYSDLQPITIHFDGSIDKRVVNGNHEYSMDLYYAKPGDIVVAKIDLKNGAVGIVPSDWKNVVVTNHFAVYEPDLKKILPQYFLRIIQTDVFKEYLWRNKVGAEGRKEVKLEFFESQKVPVPDLEIQKEIIINWVKMQNIIINVDNKINGLKNNVEKDLLEMVGINVKPPRQRTGGFVFEWKDYERWDTYFYRYDFVDLDRQLSNVRHVLLGDVLHFTSRPWSSKDFPLGEFEYIEISSVTKEKGIIDCRKVNIKESPSRATTLIKTGDIILATTRPYLGSFAIVPERYNNCVCSSGFALADSLLKKDIDKKYLLLFLKSIAGLRQMERRMTGGLYPAIVQEELERVKIPVPSFSMQRVIVKKYENNHIYINDEMQKAELLYKKVTTEIESLILGSNKVRSMISVKSKTFY